MYRNNLPNEEKATLQAAQMNTPDTWDQFQSV